VWGLDFALRNQEGVHLRLTMVEPSDAALAVAKGRAPGGGTSSYEMTWAVVERTADRVTPPCGRPGLAGSHLSRNQEQPL